MVFERGSESDDGDTDEDKEYKYSIEIKEGFTISSDEPISMEIDGETVYDEDIIREETLRRLANTENGIPDTSESQVAKKILEKTTAVVQEKKKELEYQGSLAVFEEKSYKLTVFDNEKGSETKYTAHLVDIGDDLFLDLYPITDYDSKDFSDNYFPVHTFYKVEVTQDQFTMIHFDLDKLNDLFKSNLIRLRHENVDGTILITAQPKELQKFFDKYADDDSVFDSVEKYSRASL